MDDLCLSVRAFFLIQRSFVNTSAEPSSLTQAVLLDIEGTTTSISFVYDVLFPYAREHMARWLEEHWGEETQDVLSLLIEDVETRALMPEGKRLGADSGPGEVAAHCLWQMDQDRKSTGLKTLQGRIWKDGYAAGQLKAHVYEDVPGALRAWNEAGCSVSIYSSGSVQAQELLFGHTEHGDLRSLLRAHFDTRTGAKREAESYRAIATALELAPEGIVFATDVVAEAEAARDAGMQAVIMDRPGNHPQPEHDFRVCATFEALV